MFSEQHYAVLLEGILEIGCTQDIQLISFQLSTVVRTSAYVASVSLSCSQASVAVQCFLASKCLSQFLLQTTNHCLSACKLYTIDVPFTPIQGMFLRCFNSVFACVQCLITFELLMLLTGHQCIKYIRRIWAGNIFQIWAMYVLYVSARIHPPRDGFPLSCRSDSWQKLNFLAPYLVLLSMPKSRHR